MNPKTLAILAMIFAALLGSVGQILLKKANIQFDYSIFTNWKLWAFCIVYGSAVVINIVAYRYGEAGVLYPIIACSYLFVIILASIFLGEKITWMKVLGSGLIIGGVVMIAA